MQGNPEVIELLNDVLTAELTAINQYFIHAKMMSNWGYERLATRTRAESIDEMHHAEQVIERILFLDGMPEHAAPVTRCGSVRTCPSSSSVDVELEYAAVKRLNDGIAACVAAGDNATPRPARAHPRQRGRARRLAGDPARPARRPRRHGLPGRTAPRLNLGLRRQPPLRFGWLLLAALGQSVLLRDGRRIAAALAAERLLGPSGQVHCSAPREAPAPMRKSRARRTAGPTSETIGYAMTRMRVLAKAPTPTW